MKILIDARLYGIENAGIGRYLINLIEELKNITYEADSIGIKDQFLILLRKNYYNNIALPDNWEKIMADFGVYGFKEQLFLPAIINKEKPDIIHFPHFNVPLLYRGKFITTIHDMTMHKQGINATKLPLPIYLFKRAFYKMIFRNCVLRSSQIITPSNTVANELSEYFKIEKNKIKVIYEGVDQLFSKTVSSNSDIEILSDLNLKKDNYFFYVGNLYPHKNVKLAIDAIMLLNNALHTDYTFCIAGSKDAFFQKTQNYVQNRNAGKQINFLGKLSDEQLRAVYKNSIAFIYPSLAEGFGLQGLEAIASGTVVLVSDIPVFREIYTDNVYYFNPMSVDSLVECMKKSVKLNYIDKTNIVQMTQKILSKYNWTEAARSTLQVYKGI